LLAFFSCSCTRSASIARSVSSLLRSSISSLFFLSCSVSSRSRALSSRSCSISRMPSARSLMALWRASAAARAAVWFSSLCLSAHLRSYSAAMISLSVISFMVSMLEFDGGGEDTAPPGNEARDILPSPVENNRGLRIGLLVLSWHRVAGSAGYWWGMVVRDNGVAFTIGTILRLNALRFLLAGRIAAGGERVTCLAKWLALSRLWNRGRQASSETLVPSR
jgi:hypothetical protein